MSVNVDRILARPWMDAVTAKFYPAPEPYNEMTETEFQDKVREASREFYEDLVYYLKHKEEFADKITFIREKMPSGYTHDRGILFIPSKKGMSFKTSYFLCALPYAKKSYKGNTIVFSIKKDHGGVQRLMADLNYDLSSLGEDVKIEESDWTEVG